MFLVWYVIKKIIECHALINHLPGLYRSLCHYTTLAFLLKVSTKSCILAEAPVSKGWVIKLINIIIVSVIQRVFFSVLIQHWLWLLLQLEIACAPATKHDIYLNACILYTNGFTDDNLNRITVNTRCQLHTSVSSFMCH